MIDDIPPLFTIALSKQCLSVNEGGLFLQGMAGSGVVGSGRAGLGQVWHGKGTIKTLEYYSEYNWQTFDKFIAEYGLILGSCR